MVRIRGADGAGGVGGLDGSLVVGSEGLQIFPLRLGGA